MNELAAKMLEQLQRIADALEKIQIKLGKM